jgi:hypothetical protein
MTAYLTASGLGLDDPARSAQTTHLVERLLWVAGLLVVVLAVYLLMWRAWRRRAARHGDLPELPAIPERPSGAAPAAELTGRYHGSTTSGDWLDRIVARGLGTRSLAELALTGDGVAVRRQGAESFLIPAEAVRGARLDRAIAGKVVTDGGMLVITWEHGGRLIDSGFRADRPADHPAWVRALTSSRTGHGRYGRSDRHDRHDQKGAS